MAVQTGPNTFRGKLGPITGYFRNNKHMIRRSSSLCLDQMLRNPGSTNTFKNALEMGSAISGGSLIRTDLRGLLMRGKDSQHHNRLSGLLRRALNTEPVHRKGERSLQYCDLTSLRGYNFNLKGLLNSCFKSSYNGFINRKSGVALLKMESFVPTTHLKKPDGATHFEIISICSEINFEAKTNVNTTNKTVIRKITNTPTGSIELVHNFKPKSTNQILLMMGIRFYQDINGELLQITGREFSPLSIVEVSSNNKLGGGNDVLEHLEILPPLTKREMKLLDKNFNRMMEGLRE